MRPRVEIYRNPITGLYLWRLIDHGIPVLTSQIGQTTPADCHREVMNLARKLFHAKRLLLTEAS